jgi:hypothetical protein
MQGSTISWKSQRMAAVARSSIEAELIAAGKAVQEAMHLQWLHYFLQVALEVLEPRLIGAMAVDHLEISFI